MNGRTDLAYLLVDRANEIVADAALALKRSHLEHYEAAGDEIGHARLRQLQVALVEGLVEQNGRQLAEFAESVARERFHAGFDLREVQTAFNVLEEALWRTLTKNLAPEDLGEALAQVSTLLGMGKDTLARTYVALACKTRAPSLDCEALFRGTDS
ncbi:hypothetical protein K8I85_17920 [bacterium]|nr:hypothetical protein [bacterium]